MIKQSFIVVFILMAMMLIVNTTDTNGQDKLELGLFFGGSYYMGDLNPSQQFKETRPAIGGIARYAINDRWAIKANAIVGGIAGKYPDSGDTYLHDESYTRTARDSEGNPYAETNTEYSFDRTIADVGIMGEVNFRSYDHIFKKSQTRFTPYLTLGFATTMYKRYEDKDDVKTVFVLSLPFGFGTKYKVNKWLRLGFEWTWRKTFTDDLDRMNTNESLINPANPYGLGKTGWTHNNDWYSFVGVTVTCSMWPRKLSCYDGGRDFNRR